MKCPCQSCNEDLGALNEFWYMVSESVWTEMMTKHKGFLCIGCLEKKLGRQLTAKDFTNVPCNMQPFPRSERLQLRMASDA